MSRGSSLFKIKVGVRSKLELGSALNLINDLHKKEVLKFYIVTTNLVDVEISEFFTFVTYSLLLNVNHSDLSF